MADPESLEHERLLLERDKLRFKRQKFAAELRLKRRASSGSAPTLVKEVFANPLALAIVGGFLTLMTGIVTTAFTAAENRKVEADRASYARDGARDSLQADLIKKFVEGPSPSAVRSNLKFLIDAGLLPSYAADITKYLKDNPDSAPQVSTALSAPSKTFDEQAFETHVLPTMRSLIADFGLADSQAAAVVGNFAEETNGFRVLKQMGVPDGQGGIGYAMWEGARRVDFLNFAQTNSLDPMSATANYQFVKQELRTTERGALTNVKRAVSLEEATVKFQALYTRSGSPNISGRIEWARLVLQGFRDSAKAEAR